MGGALGAGRRELLRATGDSIAVGVGTGGEPFTWENEGTSGKNKIILRLAPRSSRSRKDRSKPSLHA
jgi:hypothetical protein